MNVLTRYLVLVAAAVPACFAASTVFTISPYNALVFGAFSDPADIGGGVAAAGSLTIGSTDVAGALLGEALSSFPGSYTLVSGGNMNATNGEVSTGNAYAGGAADDFSLTMLHGSYTHAPAADPLNFTSLDSGAISLSAALAAEAPAGTCTSNGFGTTTCTATATGVTYIDAANSLFNGNNTVNITLGSSSSYVVINVSGTSDSTTAAGIKINGGAANGDSTTSLAHNVLWNYYQATNLTIYNPLGSILAPSAAVVSGQSGQIDGQLIASSFSQPVDSPSFTISDLPERCLQRFPNRRRCS